MTPACWVNAVGVLLGEHWWNAACSASHVANQIAMSRSTHVNAQCPSSSLEHTVTHHASVKHSAQ